MFRKLVSSFAVLALLITGFSSASPAQAWPDYTATPTSIAVSLSNPGVIPIGKTINSDAVFVFSENPNDAATRYIKSYTVSPSGDIQGPFTIVSNTQEANYRLEANDAWIDASGKFNLVYWTWRSTNAGLESVLSYVNSADGISWSAPQILESFIGSSAECQQSWCGIRSAQVAVSPTGTVALTYVETETPSVTKLYLVTKKLGKPWGVRAALNTSAYIHDSVHLKPLGKGWLATWSFWGSESSMYSAYSSGDALQTWTTPQLRETGGCVVPMKLMQISPTKYGLIYVTGCQDGSQTETYKYQAFDMTSKRFGSAVTLDTVPNRGISITYETQYLAGQSAFGYSLYNYESQDSGAAKYVLFRNGVPSVQFVNESAVTVGGFQAISGLSMDPLGHLSVIWTNFSGSTMTMTLSQIFRGNRSDTNLALGQLSTQEKPVVFSPDGDVYVSHATETRINAIVRIRSDFPDIEGAVAITGKAKSNATLKAKLPAINPTQLFQSWSSSYQWISCQYQVPEASTLAPISCTDVANAKAATYKVKAGDKGRYLVLKLTVKSDNASQVLYTASTSVVK